MLVKWHEVEQGEHTWPGLGALGSQGWGGRVLVKDDTQSRGQEGMQRKADGVQLVYREGPLGKSGSQGHESKGSRVRGFGATENDGSHPGM